jgi:hypothetical protein
MNNQNFSMGDIEQPPYDRRDDWVIANNIFHELCELDADDRQAVYCCKKMGINIANS